MKALLVNGSPHPRGCTYTALTELKNILEAEGIEVELLHVGNKDIRGCIACRKCAKTGKCVFDDVVNEVAPKLAEADAFVIGCPVYFASPAGGALRGRGIRRRHQGMVNLHSMVKLQPFSPAFPPGDFMAGAFQRLSLWNSKE